MVTPALLACLDQQLRIDKRLQQFKLNLTKLVGKPEVVSKEVGHVVVQPFKHVQGIVNEKHRVIIPVQHPLEVVIAMKMGGQEWGHPCPAVPTFRVLASSLDHSSQGIY